MTSIKKYQELHPDRVKASIKKYREKNLDACQEKDREQQKEAYHNNTLLREKKQKVAKINIRMKTLYTNLTKQYQNILSQGTKFTQKGFKDALDKELIVHPNLEILVKAAAELSGLFANIEKIKDEYKQQKNNNIQDNFSVESSNVSVNNLLIKEEYQSDNEQQNIQEVNQNLSMQGNIGIKEEYQYNELIETIQKKIKKNQNKQYDLGGQQISNQSNINSNTQQGNILGNNS